jgi:hypothetical protein
MKAYWGSGYIEPHFLDLGTGWRWEVSFTAPAALPPGKEPLVHPLDRRLGRPQSQSGRGGEEKNSQPVLGLEPTIIRPVSQFYTAELSRLLNKNDGKEKLKGVSEEMIIGTCSYLS